MTKSISILPHLGELVRTSRESLQLSQESLAELASLHRTYVGGVERGERNVSIETLTKLLTALGISWSDFGHELDRLIGR